MEKRKYTIVYERDEEDRIFVSYLENIDGVESTEPTENLGRTILNNYTNIVSKLGVEGIFKDSTGKKLIIEEEVEF